MVRTREQHHADRGIVARFGESIVEFNGGQWRERIATLGTVDRDLRDPVKRFVISLYSLPRCQANSLMDASPFLSRFFAVSALLVFCCVRALCNKPTHCAAENAPLYAVRIKNARTTCAN